MNLQQLRYLAAIVQSDLNISAAARLLRTSQPGISKQLQMLELETGIPIFVRDGNALSRVTPEGSQLIGRALRILDEVESIERLSADARNDSRGSLSLGTTHTQARYVLPQVFDAFRARYPEVQLDLHQGTSEQIAAMVKVNQVDFVLATGGQSLFRKLVMLPVYRWTRKVVVPHDHPLANVARLTLEELVRHPIVTYVFNMQGSSSLLETFEHAGLRPRLAMTARDADVIKTYVRHGFGAGIIASMAYEPDADADLVCLDAGHLFPQLTTWLGMRTQTLMRGYMYDFIEMLAPHADRRTVDRVRASQDSAPAAEVLGGIELPLR